MEWCPLACCTQVSPKIAYCGRARGRAGQRVANESLICVAANRLQSARIVHTHAIDLSIMSNEIYIRMSLGLWRFCLCERYTNNIDPNHFHFVSFSCYFFFVLLVLLMLFCSERAPAPHRIDVPTAHIYCVLLHNTQNRRIYDWLIKHVSFCHTKIVFSRNKGIHETKKRAAGTSTTKKT